MDSQEAARIGALVSVPDGTGQLSRFCARSTRHRTTLRQVSPSENMCANLVGPGSSQRRKSEKQLAPAATYTAAQGD